MSKEALKLALETLEVWKGYMPAVWDKTDEQAITALREALAEQPAQDVPETNFWDKALNKMAENARELGLDYEPAQQEPIKQGWDVDTLLDKPIPLKDSYKPAQQEPVAVHQYRSPHCSDWYDGVPDHHDGHGPYEVRTLYTSPPAQRKPLTFSKLCDIEYEITHRDGDFSILKFARAIEAAHGIKENT